LISEFPRFGGGSSQRPPPASSLDLSPPPKLERLHSTLCKTTNIPFSFRLDYSKTIPKNANTFPAIQP